jgi:hypothetical protein
VRRRARPGERCAQLLTVASAALCGVAAPQRIRGEPPHRATLKAGRAGGRGDPAGCARVGSCAVSVRCAGLGQSCKQPTYRHARHVVFRNTCWAGRRTSSYRTAARTRDRTNYGKHTHMPYMAAGLLTDWLLADWLAALLAGCMHWLGCWVPMLAGQSPGRVADWLRCAAGTAHSSPAALARERDAARNRAPHNAAAARREGLVRRVVHS